MKKRSMLSSFVLQSAEDGMNEGLRNLLSLQREIMTRRLAGNKFDGGEMRSEHRCEGMIMV